MTINEMEIEKILNGDGKLLNERAKSLGKIYADRRTGLSRSQIRNVLNEIQNMTKYNEIKVELLKPKIAYVAGKNYNVRVRKDSFYPIMEKMISRTNKDNFDMFKNFIEAIVAYHRFYGGKE